jgi:hypothetical protein
MHQHPLQAPDLSDGDDAAVAADRGQALLNHFVGRSLQAHPLVLDERADFPRNCQPDEVLARARGGDGA